MAQTASTQTTAVAAVAEAWCMPESELQIVSIQATFAWCKRFVPFLVTDAQRHRAAAASDGETVLCFASSPKVSPPSAMAAKIQALNALFEAEKISLPRDLSPQKLAEAARTFLREPGGVVASRELYTQLTTPRRPDSKTLPLDAWLYVPPPHPSLPTPRSPALSAAERRALFERQCVDPELVGDESAWQLSFNHFTLGGAVESWSLQGSRERGLTQATVIESVPPGTFTPPFG